MERTDMSRIALITGGASGMGLATARLFAAEGFLVAIGDLPGSAIVNALKSLQGSGHGAFPFDISDETQVADGFAQIEKTLGPIAVLITSAGVTGFPRNGQRVCIEELALDDWERTMAVNARGTFLCIREMLRWRREQPVSEGRIITISSSAAQTGGIKSGPAYVASKGAVMSLTKVAAREAAALGITVNTIAPGAVDTPMLRAGMPPEMDAAYCATIPIPRLAQPEEIAATALFLASSQASYMTGSCIDVNGGSRMQ
jgi:3-oxoacyl-[acyl-carrier protein] reductase